MACSKDPAACPARASGSRAKIANPQDTPTDVSRRARAAMIVATRMQVAETTSDSPSSTLNRKVPSVGKKTGSPGATPEMSIPLSTMTTMAAANQTDPAHAAQRVARL